ncbi:HAMP domain-containing sensor histidine kinase [Mameliella alba]|uniref:sensor histidine kinase n=1 Tax=Mameliella alba TaxID=561184 RepID=UPI001555B602|nr:HAMP domain-containing sensor histidine kinase [Mameliella alba]
MRSVLALFLACSMLLILAPPLCAEAPPTLVLDPETPGVEIGDKMRFAPGTGDTLASLADRHTAGHLSSSFDETVAKLRPYQPLWAVVEVQNGAPADGRPPDDWVLASDIYGLIALDVVLVRLGAETDQLLAHDIRKPFAPGDYTVTRVVSRPFELRPQERALLLVRMVHGTVEALDLSLERGAYARAKGFASGLSLAGFYAFLLSCLAIFAVFSAMMRAGTGLAYAGLLLLGLVFVAYLDSFLFRWLYPARPDLHLPVGLVLLLGITALGFLAALLSLRLPGSEPAVLWGLGSGALAALAAILAVPFVPPEIMAPLAYVLLAAMLVAQVFAVFQWEGAGDRMRPILRLIPLIALIGLGGVTALALARSQAGGLSIPWTIKGTYATLALGIMAGLSAGLIDMRRAHAAALAREMEAVRKEAGAMRDLLEAERNYARMRDLADSRRMQMASMSHDIRQPLSALRLSIERMAREAPQDTRDHLREAFDYIQTLTGGQLDVARDEVRAEAEDETAPYPLSLVQEAVGQMFRDEARAKGLDLRIVPSTAQVRVPALHLMRILSNLVSNAVKYTRTGRILVGVRRQGDKLALQVLDTGPGMTENDLTRNMKAWQSGTDSQGHGLGLAICHQLAQQNGLVLRARSRVGKGTAFTLDIPPEARS